MVIPASSIYDRAPGQTPPGERILLLMLPGAKNSPQQLVEYGFISSLRERDLTVDVLVLDTHVDLYLERANIEQLLHQTLNQLHTDGYRRIWLLGISLGGTGAMLCATQHKVPIEGLIMLAPFLGTRGIIAEISAAGGLHCWLPGEITERDQERELLRQLKHKLPGSDNFPQVFLGYGREDRYRDSSIILTPFLPEHHVSVIPGGHDWETWVVLWQNLLNMKPFTLTTQ